MDERVKFKVRRTGPDIYIDLWFDEVQLGSRLVVGGDDRIAEMVESGELKLTRDSRLVYADGEEYIRHIRPRVVRFDKQVAQNILTAFDQKRSDKQ